MTHGSRALVVSSFTAVKGALIEETYTVFRHWDFDQSREENLRAMIHTNSIGSSSANWLRDVYKVLHRRFEPSCRDRPLVELAKAGRWGFAPSTSTPTSTDCTPTGTLRSLGAPAR